MSIIMRLVIIESPYAGDVILNVAYAREALFDSLLRGEAPIASHLLYPQVLDDSVPSEREQGIAAGLAWCNVADLMAVYTDLGISRGMTAAMKMATDEGIMIEERSIRS